MSSPKVKFPEATPQEEELQKEQTSLLRQQRDALSEQIRQQDLLAPLLWGAAGIEPIYDKNHKIQGYKQKPDELAGMRGDIEKAGLQRSLAALRGELPEDPALLRDLADQERVMNESLRKQLGPGYNVSSPGQAGIGEFMQRKNALLDAARRGDLTLGEQLSLSRQQQQSDQINQFLQRAGGIGGMGYTAAGALGGAAQGYNAPLQYMLANRSNQFGARALNFQYEAYSNPWTSQGAWRNFQQDKAIAGGMGGAAMSTAKVKKDIVPLDQDEYRKALKKLRDTPVTRWRYEWEPDDREPHIGPILELSPKEIRASDTHISLLDYLGLTHAAVKGLDREVRSLRRQMED